MYIKAASTATRRVGVRNPDSGDLVYLEFNDDGVARTKKEIGELAVEQYDGLEIIERESTSNQED